jgi:hypothetical protein
MVRFVRHVWDRYQRGLEGRFYAVGGPFLTLAFWTILAVFLAALLQSPVLTMGDYNYHLALAGILRRMASPGSPERELYTTNLISYNASFQISVAALAFIMPVERAGQVIYGGFWVAFCLSTIALFRATKQPTSRAFVVFPLFLSVPAAWGFANYCVSMSLQLYLLARVIRRERTNVPASYDVVTSVFAVLGLLSHLFGAAIGYVLVFIALVVRTWTDRSTPLVSYTRTLREGLPFLPPLAVAAAIQHHQNHLPFEHRDPEFHADMYAFGKVEKFFDATCEFYSDRLDATRLRNTVIILVVCALFRAPLRGRQPSAVKGWLFGGALLLYLVMPAAEWRVAVLFQRIAPILVVCLAVAIPRAYSLVEKLASASLAVVGFQSAFAYYAVRRAQLPDLRNLERVVAEAPPGKRLAVHNTYTALEGQFNAWGGHLAPYYVAKKGLESSVTYAGKPSSPLHYKNGIPPLAADALAQGVAPYSPSAPYARRFELVLVRSREENPGARIWGKRLGSVDLVSHHGDWWLYDVERYWATP